MTADDRQAYRAPSVRVARRVGPRLDGMLEDLRTCPACGGWFHAERLAGTLLLVCADGCPGRVIASALGLDGWPEASR